MDGGATPCNCTPPLDKIEIGVTVVIKHEIDALANVTILIEDGGSLYMDNGRIDTINNIDIKPGGYLEAEYSYIHSINGNLNNEGTAVFIYTAIILDNGNFSNSSGLDNDGNEGVTGYGALLVTNGNILNTGLWDFGVEWCAVNGDSDLPAEEENCDEVHKIVDALSKMAKLGVTKSAPVTIKSGMVLTYTIVVTNNGPHDAVNVNIIDNVPVQMALPDYSTDGGDFLGAMDGKYHLRKFC